jgi:VRR-NUC domain
MPSEHEEQVLLIKWCWNHPDKRIRLIYSHLNGMRTTVGTAIKARDAGARRGIPDLFLPVATENYHGLYIELKRQKGGVVSPQQKEMMLLLAEQNYAVYVCKGAKEASEVITKYLAII